MALPALDLLAETGHALTLVARPWAKNLFAAYPWPVVSLRGSHLDSVRALREFSGRRALLLTNSFGSALEFRLARIPAFGYSRDGRSWLLREAVAADPNDHMVEYYYRLATVLTRTAFKLPPDPQLCIDDAARQRARELLSARGTATNYVVLCPLAVGLHHGKVKAWNGFPQLADALMASGVNVIAMPGPNETSAVREALPGAVVLPESDVATFAALLAGARLVVANDSGPGHLAGAVGARLISIFGATEPEKTRPWSRSATLIGSGAGWPSYEEVSCAVNAALRD